MLKGKRVYLHLFTYVLGTSNPLTKTQIGQDKLPVKQTNLTGWQNRCADQQNKRGLCHIHNYKVPFLHRSCYS